MIPRIKRTTAAPVSRGRLADENGQAMVFAMVTLLIVSILAIGAVTLSLTTNQGARQDTAQIDATEAAQAGLQVALYRYNMLAPSSGNCVGDAVAAPGANGTCASSAVTMSSGATYQYYTTPVSTTAPCVGGVVTNTVNVSNICVTAVGTDKGQTARTEIRAASFAGAPVIPYPGIVGLTGITESGGFDINASEATNGQIYISGAEPSAVPQQVTLGPSGSYDYTTNNTWAPNPPITRLSSPIVLAPVNPGTSATSNANVSGMTTSNTQWYAPVQYNASNRSLTTTGASSITLTGGVYNFCSWNSSGSLTVNIATGAKVAIYIDSPNDPGSGCPAGSGTVQFSGNMVFSNPSGDPTALQMYVYQANTINFSGSFTFPGVVYAPTSTVNLSGFVVFDGGIAANAVNMSGSAIFNWDSRVSSLQAGTQGLYYRTAWGQCSTTMSSSTPTSGCS